MRDLWRAGEAGVGGGFSSKETSEVTNVTDPPASLACLGEGHPSQLWSLPQPPQPLSVESVEAR